VHHEELPDLKCADVAAAALKIQASYRGFQTRKKMKKQDSLPDLNAADVALAAVKIQSVYRGFSARKGLETSITDNKNSTFGFNLDRKNMIQTDRFGNKFTG
jgi:hypothetical protein